MVINRYNVGFKIIKYLIALLDVFIIAFFIFVLNGLIEMKPVDLTINKFINRGNFEETIYISGQEVNIYKVKPYYDYEINDNRKSFNVIDGSYYIGSNLDIIITNRNPMRFSQSAIIRDVCNMFSKGFYVGHATMNVNDDGTMMIESVGNTIEYSGVRIKKNDWIDTEINYQNDAQRIIGLRIKNLNEDIITKVNKDLQEKVGLEYNMNLLLMKKNSYYCTDLISRTLKNHNINIDYDYLYPVGNDFILSDSTFVIFVCERIKPEVFNIYYLGEE